MRTRASCSLLDGCEFVGGEINTTLGFRQFSETYETVFGVKNNYSSMVNHWLSKTEAIMFCLKFQVESRVFCRLR